MNNAADLNIQIEEYDPEEAAAYGGEAPVTYDQAPETAAEGAYEDESGYTDPEIGAQELGAQELGAQDGDAEAATWNDESAEGATPADEAAYGDSTGNEVGALDVEAGNAATPETTPIEQDNDEAAEEEEEEEEEEEKGDEEGGDDDDRDDDDKDDDDKDDDDEDIEFQYTPADQKKFLTNKIKRTEGKGIVVDDEGWVTELTVPSAGLSFNIKHLACIFSARLQVLDVSDNKLHGFASDVFSVACVALRVLRFAGNSKLKGNVLEDLGKAPLLEEIDVSRTHLHGSIKDIGVKTAKPAHATDVDTGGDGSATEMDADPPAASEAPEQTTGCPLLRILNVSHTEIMGNMEHLKGATLLEQVLCQFACITGNIKVARHWPNVTIVTMNGKTVIGSLSVFGTSTPNLSTLVLTKTGVTGELGDLAQCPLSKLDLYGTQVGGNIASLVAQPDLIEIYLSYCDVVGDVAALAANNPYLTRILLDYTYVLGDLACFDGNTALLEIGLAYSQCTGRLESLYGCTSLEYLNVYGVRGFEGLGAGDDTKEAKRLVKALRKAMSAPTICAKAVVEGRTKTCNVTI